MRLALLVLLAASLAHADGEPRLEVEMGRTYEIDVGMARGWMCDDPSLISADLVTRGERNIWIVKGAKLGATLCRVGTDPALVHYVYAVQVVPAKKRR